MTMAPTVSLVVPMLDERAHIERCIASLDAQEWPHDALEVLVVDGGSSDGSREIVDNLTAGRPWLRVVENPARRASSAFNRGIEAASGDVVCLVSAHGELPPDYVPNSVAALDRTGAAGVGGVLRHTGSDRSGRAIGLAMTSPFGMASPFRFADQAREVDTIGHPAYTAAALRSVGAFDESLERNSDYEFNFRMRRAGLRLIFDPTIVTTYRPRGSLRELGRQFWWYGRAKGRVIRRHPGSVKVRHLVPPAFVVAAALAPFLIRFPIGRRIVLAGAATYGAGVALAVSKAKPAAHDADAAVLALAFPTMHLCWGGGLLMTVLKGWR
jgi:succinoglycan biosynthesis protein ExoA